MKKIALCLLLGSTALCLGIFADQATVSTKQSVKKATKSPFREFGTQSIVKKDGVYKVSYFIKTQQKGSTDKHVAFGLQLSKKTAPFIKYYRILPKSYTIDSQTDHKTLAHASGFITLTLHKGDKVSIGIINTPITPETPIATFKDSSLQLVRIGPLP